MLDTLSFHMNRKGGGHMCIYKSGFNVQKVRSIKKKKSFEGLIVRLQQTIFALIYRSPYSKKNPVQMHIHFRRNCRFLNNIITGKFSVYNNIPLYHGTRQTKQTVKD